MSPEQINALNAAIQTIPLNSIIAVYAGIGGCDIQMVNDDFEMKFKKYYKKKHDRNFDKLFIYANGCEIFTLTPRIINDEIIEADRTLNSECLLNERSYASKPLRHRKPTSTSGHIPANRLFGEKQFCL